MRGAGGTEGGIGRFFVGLIMLIVGGYLLLDAIQVRSPGFGLGYGMYSFGGFQLRTGMILIPMILGIGMIFYDAKTIVGWILAGGSLVALVGGVLSSVRFTMRPQSSFDLIVILVLVAGGAGLLLSSLKSAPREPDLSSDRQPGI
jgi:hypothetical protein